MQSFVKNRRKMLENVEARFRIMDRIEGYVQVLTPSGVPLESLASKEGVYLAKLANDEMSECVAKYPDRFVAAVAALPMGEMDAALEETDRAIRELGMKGVLIWVDINGKPLNREEFMPLYEKMAGYDLPIWIHPKRGRQVPNYPTEDRDHFMLNATFGWPFETSLAMARLVFGGVLETYPDLKVITHHCGGQIPYLATRISSFYGYGDTPHKLEAREKLNPDKPVLDYFRLFYADTALYGNAPALMCGKAFFGSDHLLFGTDMPYGGPEGDEVITAAIEAIEGMEITDSEKKEIYHRNAEMLLKL